MGHLSPNLLLAVPCPACGVAAGDRCLVHGGGFRNDPHMDRKLSAIEAVESKRISRLGAKKSSQ